MFTGDSPEKGGCLERINAMKISLKNSGKVHVQFDRLHVGASTALFQYQ